MAIKTADLNAKLFGKVDKRRATTVQEAQKAASDKVPLIELSVAGEASIEFQLLRIPANEVKEKTSVFADNAREQSFLNELALSDILITLRDRGQQYPAVGRWIDDQHIEVLDGSRRRMACILAEQDFLIYVARDINTKHAKFLSDVANAHKPLSLYERGKEMQAMIERGDVYDQKELAKVCQCSEAIVSGALKAAALPLAILQAYPSVGELGRPTIVKLHRLFFSMSEAEKATFLDKLVDKPIWESIQASGVTRITREVTLILEDWCESIKPKSAVTKHNSIEVIADRVSYRRKNDEYALNLKNFSNQDFERLLTLIKQEFA